MVQRFERQDIAWVAAEALPPFERDDRLPVLHADRITPLVDVRAIARRRPRVVLDSVHGAGGPETARLLAQLDVSCVHLFAEPTGRFPHPPEPTLDHLQGLCEAVRDHGADVGFAQDPDGDRLAIVDENGRYIGEEYTLVLSALRVLERAAERGMTSPTLCANLSTSRMIDDLASRFGGRVVRTPVGEAHVAAAMTRENALIGGEGNGGVMLPQVTLVRNSLVGVALTLDLLASRPGMTLSEIVDSLPAYGIVKDKVDLAGRTFDNLADALAPGFDGFSVDAQDGVRLDGAEGWLHVRPSNTEPILRLIAEAPDPADARRLIERAREQLGLA